jgi:hypothetical protein
MTDVSLERRCICKKVRGHISGETDCRRVAELKATRLLSRFGLSREPLSSLIYGLWEESDLRPSRVPSRIDEDIL